MNTPPLPAEEYIAKFDPMSGEDTGPYVPEDGAALRYSFYRIYRSGECVGGGYRKGHGEIAGLASDPFITNDFERDLSLQEIEIGIIHHTYGKSGFARDVSDRELRLAAKGAFHSNDMESPEQKHVIPRSEAALAPVSPLTERGMSLFFTAAADYAEQLGFDVDGITGHGDLHISHNGKLMVTLSESGCGSHASLCSGKAQPILFPTGPYAPSPHSIGEEGPVSDGLRELLQAIKEARESIAEVLYAHDYTHPDVPVPQAQGPAMSM